MNCPECQEELKDNARFCSNCGLSFSAFNTPTQHADVSGEEKTLYRSDPLIGRVLDSKYELVARLGKGGMGAVYRARRVLIGDEVAVKVLLGKLVDDEDAVERFRREARAAAMLRHPNVVTIHDFGEARGEDAPAYIVMELVEGESLRDLLRRDGNIETGRAISLMRDICAGVGAAHRHNIWHRDLKPDNIIVLAPDEVRERENVKVVDFGIAKLRDLAGGPTLTRTGVVMGTPYYMSPEQCRGESLDARSDVYSLGAMFYEMLDGVPPFTAQNSTGVITKHLMESPPALPKKLGVPSAVEAVMMRALSKEPDERQQSASVFARELQDALKPPDAPPLARTIAAVAPPSPPQYQPSTLPEVSPIEKSEPDESTFATPPVGMHTDPISLSQLGLTPSPSKARGSRLPLLLGILALLVAAVGITVWMMRSGTDKNQTATTNQQTSNEASQPSSTGTANAPRAGAIVKNPLGMEFAYVPAGSFMMGSENGGPDEKPVHRVTIREGFYMGRYEVTQAEWQEVMGTNPSYFKGDNLPVEQVSWDDAQKFIRTLNERADGSTYRLPTEAEWEYAARAGTTGDYAGNLDAMAWYYENAGDARLSGEWNSDKEIANNNRTHLVGQKQPNAWGLYDMYGNVSEWVQDWDGNYPSGESTDPQGAASGSRRVIRGCGWGDPAADCRSAARGADPPGNRESNLGFRLVRTLR